MLWGTSSNAGKTTVSAAICRYLKKRGCSVAPYKASNLSLNSYVTESGAEIGMGQAIQAWACGMEPEVSMNPLLLKPSGKGRMQYVVNGSVSGAVPTFEQMMDAACIAFDSLDSRFDHIICEGSGSPAEINFSDTDVANIGIVRKRPMNVVLVSDIGRGGVFAAIYGTWLLIPEDVRPRLKGYIINRFSGDDSILRSAVDRIGELTGMECLGILPVKRFVLPEEDSVSFRERGSGFGDIRDAYENAFEILSETVSEKLDTERLMELIREPC